MGFESLAPIYESNVKTKDYGKTRVENIRSLFLSEDF